MTHRSAECTTRRHMKPRVYHLLCLYLQFAYSTIIEYVQTCYVAYLAECNLPCTLVNFTSSLVYVTVNATARSGCKKPV